MSSEYHLESTATSLAVYRLAKERRQSVYAPYVFIAGGLSMMLIAITVPALPWSLAPVAFKLIFAGIASVLVVFYGLNFLDRRSLRVVLTAEGITYSGLGYRLFSPWGNVANFGANRVKTEWRGGARDLRGLWLRSPATVAQNKFWSPLLYGWRDAYPTFIPLSDCAGYPGEMGQVLWRYLPGMQVW